MFSSTIASYTSPIAGCEMSTSQLSDNNKIFIPANKLNFVKKFIDATNERFYAYDYVYHPQYTKIIFPAYSTRNVEHFSKYITRTTGNMYVKMLEVMSKAPCSYYEIYDAVLKPKGIAFGNDSLSFFDMERRGLIELDHLGKYKRRYFRCTALGKEVVKAANANNVAYKVLRHFLKFKDDFDVYLINISFNPETMNDVDASAIVAMLKAIFDDNSSLHEVGSHFYFCNQLIKCLKTNATFFELFNCPEVKTYLADNASNEAVLKFNKIFSKICKKYAKANAA